jgi:hypothetical protein
LNPQNPSLRRAYCIRPKLELSQRLASIGLEDDFEFLGNPKVVMTEALPYEEKLEGFRTTILKFCKEAFINDLCEFMPLSELEHREALFGKNASLTEAFDHGWVAEEVDTIEIKTTW